MKQFCSVWQIMSTTASSPPISSHGHIDLCPSDSGFIISRRILLLSFTTFTIYLLQICRDQVSEVSWWWKSRSGKRPEVLQMNQGGGQKTSSEFVNGCGLVSAAACTEHASLVVWTASEQWIHMASTYSELVWSYKFVGSSLSSHWGYQGKKKTKQFFHPCDSSFHVSDIAEMKPAVPFWAFSLSIKYRLRYPQQRPNTSFHPCKISEVNANGFNSSESMKELRAKT